MQKKDINQVVQEHAAELMAIEGVTGLFIGQSKSGKPNITVMVIEKNKKLKERIPQDLEGYPVVIHESGVIRPLEKK